MAVPECITIPTLPPPKEITFPGGATLSQVLAAGSEIPDPIDSVTNLLAQANAGLAPRVPVFNIIDAVIAVFNCIKAIPDSLGPPPDPTKLAECIPDLAEKVDALLKLIPQLSVPLLVVGIIVAFCVVFGAAVLTGHDITVGRSVIIAVVGTLWIALAGLIVAQATGMTDISPISGMSLIGVTLMFFLSGGNVVAAIILGVAVSIGIGQCADMMSDLKSGHLIGATPKRQQYAQFGASWLGVPIAVGVIYLLWGDGGGFGPDNPALSAPQGTALAGVIDSLQQGAAPVDKYATGAAIGLGLGIFPIGGIGVLVGLAMYLPFYITMTYGVGCAVNIGLTKVKGTRWIGSTLVPVAAGFIIGEALTSLTIVLIKLALGSA